MRALVLACLVALPAAAQEGKDISREEWMERVLGNSIHYSIDGNYIGREFWLPDGRSVRYQTPDGFCQDGRWTELEGTYCFAWPGSLVCARHVEEADGTLSFPPVDANGQPLDEAIQQGEIVEGGFTCEPGLTS